MNSGGQTLVRRPGYFFLSSLSPSSTLFPFLCMSMCMHDPWERSGFKFPMTFSHHLTPKHFLLKTRPDIRLLVCTCTCAYHPLLIFTGRSPMVLASWKAFRSWEARQGRREDLTPSLISSITRTLSSQPFLFCDLLRSS